VGLKQSIVYLSSSGLIITRAGTTLSTALISNNLNMSDDLAPNAGPQFPRLECTLPSPQPTKAQISTAISKADLGDWPLVKWEPYLYGFDLVDCIHDAILNCDAVVKEKLSSASQSDNNEAYDSAKIYNFFRVMLIDEKASENVKTKRERTFFTADDSDYDSDYDLEFDISSEATKTDNKETVSTDTWLITDARRTVDYIAHEYPLRYLDSLFDIKLTVQTNIASKPLTVMPVQWHRRYVYLCKTELHIRDDDNFTKPFHVYTGFDPIYTAKKESRLFVFSRGRLMATNDDFRKLLGLKNYEADYQQGLTVIVEDVHCQLTLDPTKEGFRDCISLWKACMPVVFSYYNLTKRIVGCANQRHNLAMQAAVRSREQLLKAHHKKLMMRLNDLDLNKAPASYLTKSGQPQPLIESKVQLGEHSVQFAKFVKPAAVPKGFAMESYVPGRNGDTMPIDHELTKKSDRSTRAKKRPSKWAHSDDDDDDAADEHYYGNGGRGAGSTTTTTTARKPGAFYESEKRDVVAAFVALCSGTKKYFRAEWTSAKKKAWLAGVKDAATYEEFKEQLEQFEDFIDDDYKCRKWIGGGDDDEKVAEGKQCTCLRCSCTKDDWLEKLDGASQNSNFKKKNHLLRMAQMMEWFASDGEYCSEMDYQGGEGGASSAAVAAAAAEQVAAAAAEASAAKSQANKLRGDCDALQREVQKEKQASEQLLAQITKLQTEKSSVQVQLLSQISRLEAEKEELKKRKAEAVGDDDSRKRAREEEAEGKGDASALSLEEFRKQKEMEGRMKALEEWKLYEQQQQQQHQQHNGESFQDL
jgi:hypothetical protein